MKRTVKIVTLLTIFVMLAAFAFAGCDFTRKLSGAEMNFPSEISNAKSLSFKMKIDYKKGSDRTVIDMDCYKRTENGAEEYAYVYASASSVAVNSYKNIYADQKLYEIVNITRNSGSYYVKDGVGVDDEGNFLYHVTQKILLTSVAALVTKAKKETLNGEKAYRYDIEVNGYDISIWYNSKVLVQLYAKFIPEEGDPEEYTLSFSDYNIGGEIAADVFAKPDSLGIAYIPSPFSFEDWVSILNSFSEKLG